MSYDDLDFWKHEQSHHYLNKSYNIISRNKEVERIFIFPKQKCQDFISIKNEILNNHIVKLIKIRVVFLEELSSDILGNYLDFSLFKSRIYLGGENFKLHSFAVSFWRAERRPIQREFKVTIDQEICRKCEKYYEQIKTSCLELKTDKKDKTLITNKLEFEQLIEILSRHCSHNSS